jgi:hypothetical protein
MTFLRCGKEGKGKEKNDHAFLSLPFLFFRKRKSPSQPGEPLIAPA